VIPPAPVPVARHGRLRLALGVVAVLAVLAGGGVLARMWVLQQYYVGANADHVAIFQGVRGNVFGLPLQQMVEQSDIALTDLPQTTRSTVEDGILVTDNGLTGARERVGMLRDTRLTPCPVPVQPSAAAPVPVPVTAAPAQAAPTAPPLGDAAAPTDPNAIPPTAAVPPGGDTTPLPTFAPEPGLNCRQVG
jgi:protein phosphatase